MDKRIGRRAALRGQRVALAVAAAFLPWGEAYSLPTGENVVHGDVTVARPSAQSMQINQGTQKGIVNWQGFSIGASEHVNITQPNSTAALLNRVVGNSPSEIFGRLTANGQVFLVNNAGVLFAPSASVEVGSLLASTLSITDQNFLNGNYQFYNPGNAGSVVNQGNIVTANGYTALVGPQVRNDGVIIARSGSVALAAGDRVSLDLIGDGLISVSVDQAALDASVINTGEINAEGGSVFLMARSANALLDTVINTSGVIRAVSLVERNGEIVLDGGSRGTVSAGGKLYGGGKVSVLAGDGLVLNAEVNAPALDVAAAGDIAIGANVFSSGPISIRASEPGSDVVFTGNNFFSFGPLSIEAGGDVSFVADGTRNALVTSRGGQTINARSLAVTARGGGIASVINDLGGDQIITLTGGNLDVQMNGGGFAQLGNFGPGSQTIAVDGGQGAITVASRGVDANSFSGSAVLSSASAQTINAGSLTIIAQAGGAAGVNAAEQTITLNGGSLELRTVDGGFHAGLTTFGPGNQSISVHGGGNINVSAGNGGNAVISAENGNQTLAISGGGSFDAHTLAGGGSVQVVTLAGNQTITVRDGDHIAINAADGGSVSARAQAGTQTLSITGAGRNLIAIVAGVGGNASLTSAEGQNINAKSVEITSRDGGFASIGNNNTGDQTITVSGGGIDVHSESGGGVAFITNSGLGSQTITVSDGSGIHVHTSSGSGSGQINNFGAGNQTITVSGGGGVDVRTLSGNGFALISNAGTGNQTITVSGGTGIDVASAGGFANLINSAPSSQTLVVTGGEGIDVLSSGGSASIQSNALGQAQTITVTDADHINVKSATITANAGPQTVSITGNGLNAIALGSTEALGFSQIAGGSVQSVTAGLAGQHGSITLVGPKANRVATSIVTRTVEGGTQSIATSGLLSIIGGTGSSQTFGSGFFHTGRGQQTVNAASLELQGGSSGAGNGVFINSTFGGQLFTVSGEIKVTGGAGGTAGIFNGSNSPQTINASQTINANSIVLQGGPSGSGNGAFINSTFGGDQLITVPGEIRLTGGSGGTANRAGIVTNGNQTINGNPNLVLTGGAGGVEGAGNNVFINATGGDAKPQTINARSVLLSAGAGGDASATLTAARQVITTTGDVSLLGSAGLGALNGVRIGGMGGTTPGATNLTLSVGGDLLLRGGAAANNGVGIGSTAAAGPAFANEITIETAGSVILSSGMLAGTGARIGSSGTTGAGPGNISITAGGGIELNGDVQSTAIRTLGNVTLTADHITEGANGFIVADKLNTTTHGNATLTGPNRVASFTASSDAGNVSLTNSAPLLTLGSMDIPGSLSIDQTGDLAVGSAGAESATLIFVSGDISFDASGAIVVRGSDTTAGAMSAVVAGGKLEFNAGEVSLLGGAVQATPALARGEVVEMTIGGALNVTGGSGDFSPAVLMSGSNIDLTVGNAVRLDEGSGQHSYARIQTEIKDGVIHMVFPSLSEGGYFVNGIEGDIKHGQTGFFTLHKPAKIGDTLILEYGAPPAP